MGDLDGAVRQFLARAESCLDEYEAGYEDADATLRRLEAHVEELREELE